MSDAADSSVEFAARPFGVPGAGVQRGLGAELVVAPYAAMLALLVAPESACANLERIAALGAAGRYGFVRGDRFYARTPAARPAPRGGARHTAPITRPWVCSRSPACCTGAPMQRRFEADPELRAALLLLQEPVPLRGAFEPAAFASGAQRSAPREAPASQRSVTRVGLAQPQVQLLSNGRYHVMVTSDGGGYSRWGEWALTRWRFDATSDDWGVFCYLRDLDSGDVWSGAWQPTLVQPEHYEAVFAEGRAQWLRRDHGIELCTEIVVAQGDDVELRRTRMRNLSSEARRIEVTSYTEPVLALSAFDDAHPAFSKLFVQSEIVAGQNAILCTRRPREEEESTPWLVNAMTVHGAQAADTSFETSRADFIKRGNNNALPAALVERTPLNGAAGSVLDPALVIRRVITLAPGEEASIDLVLGVAGNRDEALQLAAKYADRACVTRACELAANHAAVDPAGLEHDRGGCPAVRAPGRRRALSAARAARRTGTHRRQQPRPVRPVAVCDLGRPADRAAAGG